MFNKKNLIIFGFSITLFFLASCYLIRLINGKPLPLDLTYDLEAPAILTFDEIECSLRLSRVHKDNKYTAISASLENTSKKDFPLENFKIWVLDNDNKTCENLSYSSQVSSGNSNIEFLCEFPNKYTEEEPIQIFAEYMDYTNHVSYLRTCSISREKSMVD